MISDRLVSDDLDKVTDDLENVQVDLWNRFQGTFSLTQSAQSQSLKYMSTNLNDKV